MPTLVTAAGPNCIIREVGRALSSGLLTLPDVKLVKDIWFPNKHHDYHLYSCYDTVDMTEQELCGAIPKPSPSQSIVSHLYLVTELKDVHMLILSACP